jgi:hypothetical protein
MGFTFDDIDTKGAASPISLMHELVAKDPRNAERIFPYIGGEEVNTHPTHAHHRYVINFEDFPLRRDATRRSWIKATTKERENWLRTGIVPTDYRHPVAADWPDLLRIVHELVKPIRDADKREARRRYWWRFAERAAGLYAAIRGLDRVLVNPLYGKHLAFTFLDPRMVFANKLNVMPLDDYRAFCVLQSRVHEVWARFFSSTLKDDLAYAPTDCLETFPFPNAGADRLEAAGSEYFTHRADVMSVMNEGMTEIYNRFNDPNEHSNSVAELRQLHDAMDHAALDAYGWSDIDATPVFEREWTDEDGDGPWRYRWPEPIRDEVLGRLLALNSDRAGDEARRGLTAHAADSRAEEIEGAEDFELEAEES